MKDDGQLVALRGERGAGGVFFLFKMRAADGDAHAFTRRSRGIFAGEGREWPCTESRERCGEFDVPGVMAALDGAQRVAFEMKRSNEGRIVGIVAQAEEGGEKALFGALLGVARARGLSIAAPERGLLLGTPEEPEKRAEAWMTLRKREIIPQIQKAKGFDVLPLGRTATELCFVVLVSEMTLWWEGNGRPSRLLELVTNALYPDERLECHLGWLSVVGPNGVYRLNFNWEVRGKHDPRIPDFRKPGCPMVRVRRATYRMSLRASQEKSLVEVGLFHPAVVECIPDPLDRFVSLRLANHRLTDRVPREVVEELKAAKARDAAEKERAE